MNLATKRYILLNENFDISQCNLRVFIAGRGDMLHPRAAAAYHCIKVSIIDTAESFSLFYFLLPMSFQLWVVIYCKNVHFYQCH